MATVTVFATLDDGFATAASAAGPGTSSNDSANELHVGNNTGTVYESFLSFDTSSLGITPFTATLALYISGNNSTTDFTIEARLYNWTTPLAMGDYRTPSELTALPLLATVPTDGLSTGSYFNLAESAGALTDNLNLSGTTRLIINSSRTAAGQSGDTAYVSFHSTQNVNDPKLVISDGVSSDDILNPAADRAVNSWTTDTGATTDLYAAIDELTASDTDYIQSPAGPTTAEYYETALETHADPVSSTGHIVHYRYQKNVAGGDVGLTVGLRQGAGVEGLTTNQQGLETDTTGWVAAGSCTIARSTAQAHSGAASLEMTSTNTFEFVASTTQGTGAIPVTPGMTVDLSAWMRAAATARSCRLEAWWFNSGGTHVANDVVATQTDSTSSWTLLTGSRRAPATAAFVATRIACVGGAAAEIHYVDDLSVRLPTAIWTHTNIANSWVTQDQTLTAPQADSITDYSDLRLRFTPDMVTTDQTVPVPTKVRDITWALSDTAVTTADFSIGSAVAGNYLIIRCAADNSGGGGAARTCTMTNQSGTPIDVATIQAFQQNNDPGAASAGTTLNVLIAKFTGADGTVRLTFSGAVVHACQAEEWSGIHDTTPVVGTPVGDTASDADNLNALTDTSVASGNLVYGAVAMEGPASDTPTQDTDTTNGSWVGLTKVGTSNGTPDLNQSVWGGYKVVTATGAQTYNPTTSARDAAALIIEFAAAPTPAPTIKTQVSWANLELPEGEVFLAHSAGINLGENWPVSGPISAGATDS